MLCHKRGLACAPCALRLRLRLRLSCENSRFAPVYVLTRLRPLRLYTAKLHPFAKSHAFTPYAYTQKPFPPDVLDAADSPLAAGHFSGCLQQFAKRPDITCGV